jgi:hypothetical protein
MVTGLCPPGRPGPLTGAFRAQPAHGRPDVKPNRCHLAPPPELPREQRRGARAAGGWRPERARGPAARRAPGVVRCGGSAGSAGARGPCLAVARC